jgi:hypothetical protein
MRGMGDRMEARNAGRRKDYCRTKKNVSLSFFIVAGDIRHGMPDYYVRDDLVLDIPQQNAMSFVAALGTLTYRYATLARSYILFHGNLYTALLVMQIEV